MVRWDKDPAVLISNALSPSEVVHVDIDEKAGAAVAVVPERQLSLAIGKEGQNARLAAWLTGFRLDIKSMSEWENDKGPAPDRGRGGRQDRGQDGCGPGRARSRSRAPGRGGRTGTG